MDIRIDVKFKFEEGEYHADILIIKLSTSPMKFLYVVHLFDDWLISQFSRRYVFKTAEHEFLCTNIRTEREDQLIQAMQHTIINHKYHPSLQGKTFTFVRCEWSIMKLRDETQNMREKSCCIMSKNLSG